MTGIVKNIIVTKNFGFIAVAGNKVEYFFHRDDYKGVWQELIDAVDEGKPVTVEFDESKTPKGMRAANVTIAA